MFTLIVGHGAGEPGVASSCRRPPGKQLLWLGLKGFLLRIYRIKKKHRSLDISIPAVLSSVHSVLLRILRSIIPYSMIFRVFTPPPDLVKCLRSQSSQFQKDGIWGP